MSKIRYLRSDFSDRPARHNNLNLIRLVLATLVVISHSAELVDGNQSREPLIYVFRTLSLGDVAVNGFFLISGYLISMSFARSRGLKPYAMRRIARIVPGYLLSFSLCFFILAPLVGATESPISFSGLRHFFFQVSVLGGPGLPGVFPGTPYPGLNGSMWTIAYEARCYMAVALLGSVFALGIVSTVLLIAWVVLLFILSTSGALAAIHMPHVIEMVFGRLDSTAQLGAMFGTGALFYLLRSRIRYDGRLALAAIAILLLLMTNKWVAEPAFAILGGYIIFFCGFRLPSSAIAKWTLETDISYGVYLYAWPIQMICIYIVRDIHPVLLCMLTIPLAFVAGLLSWTYVEKPVLELAHRRHGKRDPKLA